MTAIEVFVFVLGILMLFTFVLVVINAIWFYVKHHKSLAHAVNGEYVNYGFLVSALQFMMWGHYCLFPKRAKRDNVDHIFVELPTTVRRQLIFHWWAMILGCLLVLGGALLVTTLDR